MDMEEKPFRYSLDRLLQKKRWDRDTLKNEEATAKSVVVLKEKECERIRQSIEAAESELRGDGAAGRSIVPDRQQMLRDYIAERRAVLAQANTRRAQAQKLLDEIRHHIGALQQGVKTLERHRETKRLESRADDQRRDQKHVDELWLARRAGGHRDGSKR